MASVYDVAAYILDKIGPISTWRLQKLVYYSQAWSLVWDDEPLFEQRIEAWANGPVSPDLYNFHRRKFKIDCLPAGSPERLNEDQIETIDAVLNYYGDIKGYELSELTHMEDPWKDARGSLPPNERSNVEITLGAMADYYGNLEEDE